MTQHFSRRQFVASASGGLSLLWLNRLAFSRQAERQTSAAGRQGVAATVNPLATQAAMDCFRRGGNAIDAAVAASLMLSVVDAHNSGLGGGGLALVHLASGKIVALDGREMAPSRASAEQYRTAGRPDPTLSQEGPRAAAVPGLVALLDRLAREYGQVPWRDSLLGAASVAEDGYAISDYFAKVLSEQAAKLRKYPSSAAVLLNEAGQPYQAGTILRQRDLSNTLRQLAEHGSQWFYRGEFAERMERYMLEHGGVMRADDLAGYQCVDRSVIPTNYREFCVHGFPPPSSGGIHISQMLQMLAPYDVRNLFEQSPAVAYHLLLEVMKRAMADRAHWLGDADFAKVPKGLLDADYLRQRAASIDLTQATRVDSHGTPPAADLDLFGPGGHTTHLTTADAAGNVVALTQTVNTSFGSKVILPGTGVVLNNEMDDFSLAPGVRNAFGLLGSDANAILPRKRPLSSMSPTIVTDAMGEPVFSCGAAGGPRIITTVLQSLIRAIDLRMPPDEILAQPRVHHQWSPDQAVVENTMPKAIVEQLQKMGHDVQQIAHVATAQACQLSSQRMMVASDPRVPSSADAY